VKRDTVWRRGADAVAFANAAALFAVQLAAISGATMWEPVASAYLIWTLVTAVALVVVFVTSLGPPGRLPMMLAAAGLGAAVSLPPLVVGVVVAREPVDRRLALQKQPSAAITWRSDLRSSQLVCVVDPVAGAGVAPQERRGYLLDLLDRSFVGDRVR
jgi:hypothetical protein